MKVPASALLLLSLAVVPSRADDVSDALKAAKKAAGAPAAAPVSGAAVDDTVPIDGWEVSYAGDAEIVRRHLLSRAIPKVQKLAEAIARGTAGIVADANGRPMKVRPTDDDELLEIYRAAYRHLSLPVDDTDGYDSSNKKDVEALQTLETAARLMAENLAKTLPKRKSPVKSPSDPNAVARNWGPKVDLFPDFWVVGKKPYPSKRCPGIVLLHEYFHLLRVNPEETARSKTQLVFHGEMYGTSSKYPDRSTAYGLSNAYTLTNLTVHLANGQIIECREDWKATDRLDCRKSGCVPESDAPES